MPINKNSLQARINNLSSKTGVHQNILIKSFFFDAFLKRLSVSKYRDNFVFKGGFLLSTSLGIDLRSTMDIDFLLTKMDLNRETIIDALTKISSIDCGDNITFEFKTIDEIRKEDEYGGYNVVFIGQLENIKEIVSVDIATGDPITPDAVNYEYRCLFEDVTLSFKAYNYETIVSEKLQTILVRDVLNSRSKDFYDMFAIYKLRISDIDSIVLKEAFEKTCNYRNTLFKKDEAIAIINRISNDFQMKTRWNSYRKKNKFAEGVEFEDAIKAVLYFLEIVL